MYVASDCLQGKMSFNILSSKAKMLGDDIALVMLKHNWRGVGDETKRYATNL